MEENKLETIQMMTKNKKFIRDILIHKFKDLYFYGMRNMSNYNFLYDIVWTLEYMGYDDDYEYLEDKYLSTYWKTKHLKA